MDFVVKKLSNLCVIAGMGSLLLLQPGCGGRKSPDTKITRMKRSSKKLAILPAAAAGLAVGGPVGLLGGIVVGCVTHVACSGVLYNRRLKKTLCNLEAQLLELDTIERKEKKALLVDAIELEKEFTRIDKQIYRKRASCVVTQLQGALTKT